MTTTATARGFSEAAFEQFLARRDEPTWVRERRQAAYRAFAEMGLPDRKHEEWRRTDIRTFKFEAFGFPEDIGAAPAVPAALLTQGVELAGQSTTIDSISRGDSLLPEYERQGVLFGSLDRFYSAHEGLLRPRLEQSATAFATDKFAALNAAGGSGGTLLYVPKGVHIQEPLHVLSALTPGGVDLSQTIVILEEGAEATLLAETASEHETKALHAGAIEVYVAKDARLRYVTLQNWGHGTWHFAHQKAYIDQNAYLQWTVGALGSRLAKVNQHVHLTGEGAEVQVNGVMFTEGRQHLAYHTLQHHQAPHATSDLLYKGALQDESRLVWRGMIKVDPHAQRTNGYQRNDNLMMSSSARVDSIPGLEIEADDVICTHGATAGRVEEEQVFYAQCRGLTRREATRMIVAGFFQQVFDRITIESVREALAESIGKRIREF